MTLTTNPGSADAKRLGCTCPVLDNRYGEGAVVDGQILDDQWFVAEDCPIHVDKRRLDADSGGEGDSGSAGSAEDWAGDDSASHPVPTESVEPTREAESPAPLSGADGGRSVDPEVRGEAPSERPTGGPGAETPA